METANDSLTRLLSALNAKQDPVPEGYYSVAQLADAARQSRDAIEKRLRGLVQRGKADRVKRLVNGKWTFFYRCNG